MRRLLAVLLLAPALGAQSLDWSLAPAEALATSRATGKPLLFYWVAGPEAASFAQEVDRLFAAWPAWTKQLATQVVPTRLRSWEGAPPPGFAPLPGDGKASVLALAKPNEGAWPWLLLWQTVPAPLELSHALVANGLALDEPYVVDVAEARLQDRVFVRQGDGPFWLETWADGSRTWKEEGPLGNVLLLRDTASNLRAALPFEDDWSFLYNPTGQSWTPWSPVVVKHR